MEKSEALQARARRHYELGRVRAGLRLGLWTLPMVGVSLWSNGWSGASCFVGLLLFVGVVGLRWRGMAWGQAIRPGLLAGIAPLMIPIMLRTQGPCCTGDACWSVCMASCIAGGLVAGIAIGLSAPVRRASGPTPVSSVGTARSGPVQFMVSALVLASLAGLLGCAVVGVAGVVGMVASLLASSLATTVLTRSGWPASAPR